jgi:hypothetical protein
MRMGTMLAVAAVAALAAGAASAEVKHFTAKLDGASETPPNDSKATGTAWVDLDTASKTMSWKLEYSGLSGPATMAHFHGPAPVGKAAGVVAPFKGEVSSPNKGSASLTDAQIGALESGMLYINVHTAAHPGGEIRGQVTAAK